MSATVLKLPLAPRANRRDQEFLPAALEILETPPSPIRMALLLSICFLVVTALAWGSFGHIDIVAVAQGKIQPTGRVKVVQPLETGRVKALKVANGSRVKLDQILIELDDAETGAEEAGLQANLIALRLKLRAGMPLSRPHAVNLQSILCWNGMNQPRRRCVSANGGYSPEMSNRRVSILLALPRRSVRSRPNTAG